MPFHRLTTPGYFGGLPAGYDLINTGGAPADVAKSDGPNLGTYFHAFGEFATSSNFNRPIKALAENCDALDDLLHRDMVVSRQLEGVPVAPLPSVVLPAGTFLGAAGTTDTPATRASLFGLREASGRPVHDGAGAEVLVASLTLLGGDAVGMGFSTGNVQLNFSTPIPIGTTYQLRYGTRRSLATLDVDAIFDPGRPAIFADLDRLDALLYRNVAVMQRTAVIVAGAGETHVVLPAGTFLGTPEYTNTASYRRLLFTVRDVNDVAVLSALFGSPIGPEVEVLSVALTGDDAIGGGFSANPVQINFGTIVPGTSYRVYYGVEQSAATLDLDAFFSRRTFALIDGHLHDLSAAHKATAISYNGGPAWPGVGDFNPSTTVEAQLDKIISDLGAPAGSGRVGAASIAGTPLALAAGTVQSQLTALLGAVNPLAPLVGPLVDGTRSYPLASRDLVRQQHSVRVERAADGSTVWRPDSLGGFTQVSSATGRLIYVIAVPDGASLFALAVGLKAAAGHTDESAALHKIAFTVCDYNADTDVVPVALIDNMPDDSANLADYEIYHHVQINFSPVIVSNLNHCYVLSILGEFGDDFHAGARVCNVSAYFTMTAQDPGAS